MIHIVVSQVVDARICGYQFLTVIETNAHHHRIRLGRLVNSRAVFIDILHFRRRVLARPIRKFSRVVTYGESSTCKRVE